MIFKKFFATTVLCSLSLFSINAFAEKLSLRFSVLDEYGELFTPDCKTADTAVNCKLTFEDSLGLSPKYIKITNDSSTGEEIGSLFVYAPLDDTKVLNPNSPQKTSLTSSSSAIGSNVINYTEGYKNGTTTISRCFQASLAAHSSCVIKIYHEQSTMETVGTSHLNFYVEGVNFNDNDVKSSRVYFQVEVQK